MRLLFDQNLSPRLVQLLADVYTNSIHTAQLGLERASDHTIWEYAREHDLIIVSKDADFSEIITARGYPPKLISIRRGNCSTAEIGELLREHQAAIMELGQNRDLGVLLLQ